MADTVLTELKIHEFDSLAQMSQYESEIGDNDIVFTPDLSCRLPLLTPMWFDHQVNDESWLNADTFSWQPSDRYKQTYEHLVADAKTAYAWVSGSEVFYTLKETVAVGDEIYVSTTKDSSAIDSVGSNSITFSHPKKGGTITATRSASNDRLALGLMPFMQSETIDGTTVTYYLAEDGHKICLQDQESNLVALYEATGVAWCYILDTENKQFKLPRTKYGFTGLRDSVGGYVAPGLPNIQGSGQIIGGGGAGFYGSASGALYPSGSATSQLGQQSGGQTSTKINIDASRSSAIYGASDTVQPPATQMYLYFLVGAFDQTATEQTAGINAEMFNGKADRNLLNTTDNVDIVVESQLPTSANGYTWYRKYKSGWVEQGGQLTALSTTEQTVTLPIVMADTSYYANANYAGTTQTNTPYAAWVDGVTTTSIRVRGTNSTVVNACKWYVCGMAA